MTIDLTKFCAVRDLRKYLNQPFVVQGVGRVACNGNAAIVVPADVETSEGISNSLCKTFKALSVRLPKHSGGIALSTIEMPAKVPCYQCHGSGVMPVKVDCPECDGKGSFEHGSHTYDCKECDGEGSVDGSGAGTEACISCSGSGEGFQLMQVGNAHFNAALLRLFVDLPDAAIHSAADPLGTAFITFDGGWGALMPCRR